MAQSSSIHVKNAPAPESIPYCYRLIVWFSSLRETDAAFSVRSLGSSSNEYLDLCLWPLLSTSALTQGFRYNIKWWHDSPFGFIMGTLRIPYLSSRVDMTPRSCSSGDPLPRGSTIPHSGQISRVPLGPSSPLCLTVGPGQTLTGGDLPRCRQPADFMCGLSPDQHPHLLACKQGPGEMQGH